MKKKKLNKRKITAFALITLSALTLALGGLMIIKDDKISSPDEIVGNVGTTIESANMSLRLLSTSTDPMTGHVTKIFKYEIRPASADDLSINLSIHFVDESSCDEYVTVSKDETKQEITLICKKAFTKQIKLLITAQANNNARTYVTLDYQDRIVTKNASIDINQVSVNEASYKDIKEVLEESLVHSGGTLEDDYLLDETLNVLNQEFTIDFDKYDIFTGDIGEIVKNDFNGPTSTEEFQDLFKECFIKEKNNTFVLFNKETALDNLYNVFGTEYNDINYMLCPLWKNYEAIYTAEDDRINAENMNLLVETWHGLLKRNSYKFEETYAINYQIKTYTGNTVAIKLTSKYILSKSDYTNYITLPISITAEENIVF